MNREKEIEKLIAEINQKKSKVRKGWLFTAMAVLALIDVPFPPLPPHLAIVVFIAFIIIAYNSFKEGFYLPVNQCLKLSKFHNDKLSASIITMELGISIHQAKKVIQILCREGLATLSDKSVNKGEVMYKITGLNDGTEKNANVDNLEEASVNNDPELIKIKRKIEEKKSES